MSDSPNSPREIKLRGHNAFADPIRGGWDGYQGACWDCDWRAPTIQAKKDDARNEALDHAAATVGVPMTLDEFSPSERLFAEVERLRELAADQSARVESLQADLNATKIAWKTDRESLQGELDTARILLTEVEQDGLGVALMHAQDRAEAAEAENQRLTAALAEAIECCEDMWHSEYDTGHNKPPEDFARWRAVLDSVAGGE